ncbi:hypothetical protein K402DRAFT_397474 [Aulographum hederae CBS 113979]|uniref:Uncharacterized protein n=1 Tax=Aulographum hederae CBS 113979 TaxID=1176131 RepID=A0A6G1GPA0_9PEZI|nr:hypothetical protein K402DRAFT_397474 [Aulographum hederae CBS 113979]
MPSCERYNARLPEAPYAINLSHIPGSNASSPVSISRPTTSLPLTNLTTNKCTITAVPPTPSGLKASIYHPVPIPSTPTATLNLGTSQMAIKTLSQTVGSKPRQQATATSNWSFTLSPMQEDEENKENMQPPPTAPSKLSTNPFAGSKAVGLTTPIKFDTAAFKAANESSNKKKSAGKTPPASVNANVNANAETPETPYYLDHPEKLVQMTCPPKQTSQGGGGGFLATGEAETPLRERLMAARRRSMEFAPRVSSPLRKGLF